MVKQNPDASSVTEIFEERMAEIQTPEKKVWVNLNGEAPQELFPDARIEYATAYWFNSDLTGKLIAIAIGLGYALILTPIALLLLKVGKLLCRHRP